MSNDEQHKADSEIEEAGADALEVQPADTQEPGVDPLIGVADEITLATSASAGQSELGVEQLQEALAAAADAALRAQAEAQNARRRAEQEVEKARKFALERFAGELLSVVDNLERSLEAAGDHEASKAITEGVELTLKGLRDVLAKFNIHSVDPAGEPFDPQLHQAMTMVPSRDLEPNTVMDVMQKGYTLNGRLLRPAMVVVSKTAE